MPHGLFPTIVHHWPIWLVSVILVLAATIDGWKLKVPNWITFPLIFAGWAYALACSGWSGLGASMAGTALGLGLLLPAYAIGGMGAGDVKLLAGVGAWIGVDNTLWAFAISALVGGLIAVAMVVWRKKWGHHQQQFVAIVDEIFLIRDPAQLSAIAAERKSRMMLLPYGIPIAIGTIGYFIWAGMLV
jgi:prepilin peptidase CpaA